MKVYQRKKRRKEPQNLDSSENPCPHSFPSSQQQQQQKKTRDLPNLTECHSCGFKVDICNGGVKNSLRTLYSEWRVVLLCNKCFSKLKSSQICSYCFSELASSSAESSFSCSQCRHSVHKNCFFDCKDAAPWSYAACSASEFSVCVDCWIPKPLAISRNRRMVKVKDVMIKKKVSEVLIEKGNSRVLGAGDLVRYMEDVVNDVNRAAEKKVDAATRARKDAMKKAVVAKRVVKKANNDLRLVGNRGEGSQNARRLKRDLVRVADGSDVTFELHPYLRSPPRISKICCLLNTNYFDTSKSRASSDGSSCKTSSLGNAVGRDKHEVSNDDKPIEDSDKSSCEPLVSIESSDSDSSTDPSHLCMGRSDSETSSKDDEHVAEFDGEEEMLKEGEESCSDRLINFGGEDSGLELVRKQADSALHGEGRCNGQCDRYFLKYRRKNYRLKTNLDSGFELDHKLADSALHGKGICNGLRDRYFLKYRRKNYRLKTNLDGDGSEFDRKQADSALHGEGICNGQCDHYFLKYRRKNYRLKGNLDSKPKILHDKIYLESQDSAVIVPFNCSKEVRTISNTSSQSFHAPLQSSACGSGDFREPS